MSVDPDEQSMRPYGGWHIVGFWIIVIGLLMLIFTDLTDTQRNPNQVVLSEHSSDFTEIVLKRNRYGQYHASGFINGHEVEFLVDTGANDVAVPMQLANELGLPKLYEVEFWTANGIADGYATKLNEVSLGGITLYNSKASIIPENDNGLVLLGMSFLRDLEIIQRGDILTIRQYH